MCVNYWFHVKDMQSDLLYLTSLVVQAFEEWNG